MALAPLAMTMRQDYIGRDRVESEVLASICGAFIDRQGSDASVTSAVWHFAQAMSTMTGYEAMLCQAQSP